MKKSYMFIVYMTIFSIFILAACIFFVIAKEPLYYLPSGIAFITLIICIVISLIKNKKND